jgi:hypothetical protein
VSATVPRFPPSVARTLTQPAGTVVTHLSLSDRLRRALPGWRTALMETPYEDGLLVGLALDPSGDVVFVRTGPREGPREARTSAAHLLGTRDWVVTMTWDPEQLSVDVGT